MRTLRTILVTALALVAGLALGGCGHRAPLAPDPAVATGAHTTAATPLDGARHVEGTTGPGSIYALDVPADWNGDLVLYAHGVVLPPGQPVGLPGNQRVRDLALARGFAVATSSFDENGYCVKDGAQRTHQLVDLFTASCGAPRRIYLVGTSLGGIITLDLAETYPEQFAGALSLAGVVGGTLEELDYVASVRLLYDCMYPGVLPGTLYQVPPIASPAALQDSIVASILRNPQGAGVIAALEPRLPYSSNAELVRSIVSALMFQLLGATDLTDRVRGHSFYDNHDRIYAGALPQPILDYVNAHVARFTADPDAVQYMRKYYSPSGRLRIPTITLHNRLDPLVPYVHEDILQRLAAAQGCSATLRQYPIAAYGHDNFSTADIAARFDELIAWSRSEPPRP